MKHNIKLVLAFLLAAMMIVGNIATLADNDMVAGTVDTEIRVGGLAIGDTVKFYQVLEWKGAAGAWGGWSLTSMFANFANDFTGANAAEKETAAVKALIGDPKGNPPVAMQLTAEIAGKLARLADQVNGGTAGSTVANGISSLTVSDLGLYMALIDPADENTIYSPVFVSADYNATNGTEAWTINTSASYSDTAAAKKTTVTLTKQDAVDDTTSYDDTSRFTRIGEVVSYTVTTTIPGYGPVYENPHFVIKDQLTALEMTSAQQGAITVTVGGTSVSEGASTYTLDASATGYTITFAAAYLQGITVPTEVVVGYAATVTTDAVSNINIEENEVWIEYSHNPTDENDFDYKKDDTNHYTFTIDANILGGNGESIQGSGSELIKVGLDASGNPINEEKAYSYISGPEEVQGPLAGAEFKLYETWDASTKTGTEYTKVDGNTLSLTSDAQGRINIPGLDAGTYYLVEDKAPNGFIKYQSAVRIDIETETEEKEFTMWTDGTNWYDDNQGGNLENSATYSMEVLKSYSIKIDGVETAKYTFWNDGETKITISDEGTRVLPSSIPNTQGVELPSTGGIGTTIFYVGGSLMVLAAAILLITKRRMGVED